MRLITCTTIDDGKMCKYICYFTSKIISYLFIYVLHNRKIGSVNVLDMGSLSKNESPRNVVSFYLSRSAQFLFLLYHLLLLISLLTG